MLIYMDYISYLLLIPLKLPKFIVLNIFIN